MKFSYNELEKLTIEELRALIGSAYSVCRKKEREQNRALRKIMTDLSNKEQSNDRGRKSP